MRTRTALPVRIRQNEFLDALSRANLARIQVSVRIHRDGIDYMELACHRPVTAH